MQHKPVCAVNVTKDVFVDLKVDKKYISTVHNAGACGGVVPRVLFVYCTVLYIMQELVEVVCRVYYFCTVLYCT